MKTKKELSKEELQKINDWWNSLTILQITEIAGKYYNGNIEKLFNIDVVSIWNKIRNLPISDIEMYAKLILEHTFAETSPIDIYIYEYFNIKFRIAKYKNSSKKELF